MKLYILYVFLFFSSGMLWYALRHQYPVVSPPPSPVEIVTSSNTLVLNPDTEWKEFRNTALSYSVKYPTHPYSSGFEGSDIVVVGTGNDYAKPEEYVHEGHIYIAGQGEKFFEINPGYLLPASSTRSLEEYVQQSREMNMQDKEKEQITEKFIGEIESATINGKQGYSFLMNHSYATPYGGHAISPKEMRKYIFVNHKEYVIMISVPEGNPVSEKILSTFRFE
jgi:hypothetical protein